MGTRFLATKEALVSRAQKEMTAAASSSDIVYTPNISGLAANFLRPSIVAAGFDPSNLAAHGALDMQNEAKAWRNIWSAGQGVAAFDDIPSTADLCARLEAEYHLAVNALHEN